MRDAGRPRAPRGAPAVRAIAALSAWLAFVGGCSESAPPDRATAQDPSVLPARTSLPAVPDSSFVGAWRVEKEEQRLELMGSGAATLSSPLPGHAPSVRSGGWAPTGDGAVRVVLTARDGATIPSDTIVLALRDSFLVATSWDTVAWGRTALTMTRARGSR